jgi:hypothetical protein
VFRPISAQLEPAASVTPNTIHPVTAVLEIQVNQNQTVVEGSFRWIGILLSLPFLLLWRRMVKAWKFGWTSVCLVICLGGLAAMSGCGSGAIQRPPTKPGTYQVVVTGTSTALTSSGQEPTCSGNAPGCVPDLVQQATITLIVK